MNSVFVHQARRCDNGRLHWFRLGGLPGGQRARPVLPAFGGADGRRDGSQQGDGAARDRYLKH